MSAAGRMLSTAGQVLALALLALTLSAAPVGAQTEVVEYYGQDALGSIRVVFDANGAAVARADYEPFGELFAVPGTPGTGGLPAKQFTGQERDAEASLDYFGARFLTPRTGRFSEIDPVYAGLFDPQQWNRYGYARNNPLAYADPSGMQLASGYCPAEFRTCEDGQTDGGGGGGGEWGWGMWVPGWPPPPPPPHHLRHRLLVACSIARHRPRRHRPRRHRRRMTPSARTRKSRRRW